MKRLSSKMAVSKVRDGDGNHRYTSVYIWCPGCDELHGLAIEGKNNSDASWDWNKDPEKPTFSPSVLVTRGGRDFRCHSFIKNGVWEFLTDCTHELAGQQVPMVDLPDWVGDR